MWMTKKKFKDALSKEFHRGMLNGKEAGMRVICENANNFYDGYVSANLANMIGQKGKK